MSDRTEKDALGEVNIDQQNKWGAQTQRSLKNFPIGQEKMPLDVIYALAYIKKAAALTNAELGKISKKKAQAIKAACEKILSGELDEQFPLAVWQTGSGTQSNMNVNEVIAHIVKTSESSETVHPNDDVNKGQSSNDTFPTAMQIAVVLKTRNSLLPVLEEVKQSLLNLENQHKETIKIGRTHLQDAVPLTFGQEVSGWRGMIDSAQKMIDSALAFCYSLPLGGTAVGTGMNTHPDFAFEAIEKIAKWTKSPFVEQPNKFYGLTSKDQFVHFHGALKSLAANTMKMTNDIRWLASGPRTGFNELAIPANEPGSSIMPGKVNPTQIEALTMVCAQVMGNDTTISIAASQGNFELNVYMPVIVYNVLQSVELLADGLNSFNERCLKSLEANEEQMLKNVHQSLMLVTALAPHIGYDSASKIAKQAFEKGITLKEAALESGIVTKQEFEKYTDPTKMV